MITTTRRVQHALSARALGMSMADWSALGTSAQLVAADPPAMPAARQAVEQVLADIDLAASRFRDDSELSRLNTAGGDWIDVSPLFAQALQVGIDAARWSDGLVDPTIGAALVRLGYDRTFAQVPTSAGAIQLHVSAAPGWQHIELDADGRRARVPAGTQVDLGATAKALAADLAAAAAAAAGGCGVLVSLGGDIAVAGEPPAAGWPIAIEDVTDLSLPAAVTSGHVIAIHEGGLATSSTRARRWQRGGAELHHLLDPRSGLPAAGPWRTVSVTAVTCVLANTASTAAVILGSDAPSWLRERGFHARLIDQSGARVYVNEWPREETSGEQETS